MVYNLYMFGLNHWQKLLTLAITESQKIFESNLMVGPHGRIFQRNTKVRNSAISEKNGMTSSLETNSIFNNFEQFER